MAQDFGSGSPVWVDISAPTKEQLIALTVQQRKELFGAANTEIAWRQYAVDTGIAAEDESVTLDGWSLYRVRLMRIDVSTAPDIQ